MSPPLFAPIPVLDRPTDPRWRLRCDICGRFADRKTAHVTPDYQDNTPDSCDWNAGECWCKNCRGPQ